MKDPVHDLFAQIAMPEKTEEKICEAMMGHSRKPGETLWRRSLMAAAVALVLVFIISPKARAAVEGWAVKYFFPGSDITIYEMTDEKGNAVGIAGVDTEAPPFARLVNGRLYFLGNNEKIDITEEITEEKPYFYTYVDDYGLTHAMVVGYSGTMENYGIYEFIWEDVDGERDWVTGTGRNFLNNETQTRYPWVDIVWEELDIPWPMPD